MGYNVVWATGGINSSILNNAIGLVISAIYGDENGFLLDEINAIHDWFNEGRKLLWIAGDSDYGGYSYINDNMTMILSECGSHVYPEPSQVSDPHSNCNASYRVIANRINSDPFVSDIVAGVDSVLMHGPTCLYGSTSGDGMNPISLETSSISNVYPLVYYSASATIVDSDLTPPLAHNDGDQGEFVAITLETHAGDDESGVIIVSGASPYGDYKPMYTFEYYGESLTGGILVNQAIEYSISELIEPEQTTTTTTATTTTTTTTPFTGPSPLSDLSLIISVGALGVIVVFSYLICKGRKSGQWQSYT
jgi:hypothetical protein